MKIWIKKGLKIYLINKIFTKFCNITLIGFKRVFVMIIMSLYEFKGYQFPYFLKYLGCNWVLYYIIYILSVISDSKVKFFAYSYNSIS